MSASMKTNFLLTKFHHLFNRSTATDKLCGATSTCMVDQWRGMQKRRPIPNRVARKTPKFWHNRELTHENREYLKETVLDKYLKADGTPAWTPLKDEPYEKQEWTPGTVRSGVLAVKIGVQPQWTKEGKRFTTTLLQIIDNHVIRYIPPAQFATYPNYKRCYRDRTGMIVIGALSCDPSMFTKQYNNLFSEAGVPPKRRLTRFVISDTAKLQPGTPLNALHYQVGQVVDVEGITIGHGFQGVVKRWGFKGGPATHGTTKWHRRPGTIASGKHSGGVAKGKHMPGVMGNRRRVLPGLKIWRINTKYNVIYVTGRAVPGPTHSYVRIMDTKLPLPRVAMMKGKLPIPSMPTIYEDDINREQLPEDLYADDLHQLADPSITFK